jgi:hypothetical protein
VSPKYTSSRVCGLRTPKALNSEALGRNAVAHPRRLHAQTPIPRHPQRRQRRLPPRPPTAMPRPCARRSVQESPELQAARVERANHHRAGRHSPLHLQRRTTGRRLRAPRHGPHRPRRRPRPNGIPPPPPPPRLTRSPSQTRRGELPAPQVVRGFPRLCAGLLTPHPRNIRTPRPLPCALCLLPPAPSSTLPAKTYSRPSESKYKRTSRLSSCVTRFER